jgi:hypothetical protein
MGAESMLVVLLVYVIEWVVAYWYSLILIQWHCAQCDDTIIIHMSHMTLYTMPCTVQYTVHINQHNSILQLSEVVEHCYWYNKQCMLIIDTDTMSCTVCWCTVQCYSLSVLCHRLQYWQWYWYWYWYCKCGCWYWSNMRILFCEPHIIRIMLSWSMRLSYLIIMNHNIV